MSNVRFGSKADKTACLTNVRFTPESGHRSARVKYFYVALVARIAAHWSIRHHDGNDNGK